MNLGIIDYGMGNLMSVFHAFSSLGVEPTICKAPEEIEDLDKIVLPGVGSFKKCMENLNQRGFVTALNDHVISRKKPFFGICLGMQVISSRGYEGGLSAGLG